MDVSAVVAVESADAASARSAAGAEGRAGAHAPAYGGCGSAKVERRKFQFARLAATGLRAAGFRAERGGHPGARRRREPAAGGPHRTGGRVAAGKDAKESEGNEFRGGDAARVAKGNDQYGEAS